MNAPFRIPVAAKRVLLGAGLFAAVAGCAPGRDLPPVPEYQATGYRLGGGDQVRIITFGEDGLTGEFRVDEPPMPNGPLMSQPARGHDQVRR